MSDNNEYVRASELLDLARMDVETGGRKYGIRKIGPAEMVSLGGGIDLSVFLEADKKPEPSEEDASRIFEYQDKVVAAGVTSIRIALGDDADGEIHIRDLPQQDKADLMSKILLFSGLSKEEAERTRPLSEEGTS